MIRTFFMVALVLYLAITPTTMATPLEEEDELPREASDPLRGLNRILAQKRVKATMTCNNYPRVCRAKGSPGPDCCNKQCVNVSTDRLNCGMCGKKCKYSETCCRGQCVNMSSDPKNCGSCNKRCNKGSSCTYGLCDYA